MHRLFPPALALRGLERHDQIGGRREAHLMTLLRRQIAERDRQMRLADAARAEKDDVLGALDKSELASSWICWRGTPVAKLKSKPSSVLNAGKPAMRANISRARTRRASRSASQDLFEEVGKGSRLCRRALGNSAIEIGQRSQPQLLAQFDHALML